jgi:UDP-2,3-diacylglucosamine pyrophosphatase LpxH
MDPEDRDYLCLRWLLRTTVIRWLGRHLPQRIVSWIGETASNKSRQYTTGVRNKVGSDAVEEKLLTHARKVHGERAFDILIAGHVHSRLDKKLPELKARVINLGTWLDQPLVFELSKDVAKFWDVQEFISSSRAMKNQEL